MTSSNRLVFAGKTVVFGTSVTQDLRNMYTHNGGCEAHRIKDATWFFAGSIKDVAFIEKGSAFVSQDLIFESVRTDGRVYTPNYAFAVCEDGEILPAGVVFDPITPALVLCAGSSRRRPRSPLGLEIRVLSLKGRSVSAESQRLVRRLGPS
ncbi:hypothetical protein DFH09DRAFT_1301967 [Mycena vulgaris]|nr:hypothetical protein DFH09DRAFT_1301967 [Mycena vulgaris]